MTEQLSTIQDKEVQIEVLQGVQATLSTEWLFDLTDDLTGLYFKGQIVEKTPKLKLVEFNTVADAAGNILTVTSSTTATNKVLEVDCLLKTVSSDKLQINKTWIFVLQMYLGSEVLQNFQAEIIVKENYFQ